MELISREAVLNIIKGRYTLEEHDLEKDILNLPTIEGRPKGEWILHYDEIHRCSECQTEAEILQAGGGCELLSNYCPNCGCFMGEMESEE